MTMAVRTLKVARIIPVFVLLWCLCQLVAGDHGEDELRPPNSDFFDELLVGFAPPNFTRRRNYFADYCYSPRPKL
jgi:hypothetical protein